MDNKTRKELERLGNALVVIGSDFQALVRKLEESVPPATTRQPLKAKRKTEYRSLIRARIIPNRIKQKP